MKEQARVFRTPAARACGTCNGTAEQLRHPPPTPPHILMWKFLDAAAHAAGRIKQSVLHCIRPGTPSGPWLHSSSVVRVHAMCRGCQGLMLAGGVGPKGHRAAQMRGPRRLIWHSGARLGAATPYIWVQTRWASS